MKYGFIYAIMDCCDLLEAMSYHDILSPICGVNSSDQKGLIAMVHNGLGYVASDLFNNKTLIEMKNNWINVEDRLPDHNSHIIMALSNGEVHSGRYQHKSKFYSYNLRGIIEYLIDAKVTHWQPLPEAPSNKSDDNIPVISGSAPTKDYNKGHSFRIGSRPSIRKL